MNRRLIDRATAAHSPARCFVRMLQCACLYVLMVDIAAAQPPQNDGSQSDPSIHWNKSRVYPALEAVQAAAADETYIYAISNSLVAKYSRASGERVAISQGEAKHLNSGYFWNGLLYCAHSNYPQKPERSQIKVLDVHTMQLSTFKDFAEEQGSLTWAVRHEGRWWCNFAYYGRENGRTSLVEFDDDWQVRRRWTYPPDLLGQLGDFSLSGGLWQGDVLLVTGHDDRLIFRLRLPEQGRELEYLDRQEAPFTGQGFAADPVSGGLVGIHRSERQVVIAAEARASLRLSVLSYNIHHGEGVDGHHDLERIANVIRSVSPDLVALQEVDRNTLRSMSVDQPERLAQLTQMNVVFGKNIELGDGQYGNAVLSRFPIHRHLNHALPNLDSGEQRGVLEVEIQLPDGRQRVLLFATHLDHRNPDQERVASALTINELIATRPTTAAILAGDLNDLPESATLTELAKQWTKANQDPLPTVPVHQPKRQIDYVLFRPASRWRVITTEVLNEATASDHRAILAVLEVDP